MEFINYLLFSNQILIIVKYIIQIKLNKSEFIFIKNLVLIYN
jgi:hypothetical protein